MGIKWNIASISSRFPLAGDARFSAGNKPARFIFEGFVWLWLQDIWSIMTRFQPRHCSLRALVYDHFTQAIHFIWEYNSQFISKRWELVSFHSLYCRRHYRQWRGLSECSYEYTGNVARCLRMTLIWNDQLSSTKCILNNMDALLPEPFRPLS